MPLLGLAELDANYATAIAASLVGCFALQLGFPVIGSQFASYRKASGRTKRDWAIHAVALLHALYVVSDRYATPVAVALLRSDHPSTVALRNDPILGFDPRTAWFATVSIGYFAWDAIVSAMFYGPGFILHGVVCFGIFLNSFRPHCHGFAGIFLLWELSTIPLNINWFLDKTDQTGSTLQLVNGAVLLLSFFGVRLAMGVWSTWYFASNLFTDRVRAKMARGAPLLYFAALMSLNFLNVFWFRAMIQSLRKRFDKSAPVKAKQ